MNSILYCAPNALTCSMLEGRKTHEWVRARQDFGCSQNREVGYFAFSSWKTCEWSLGKRRGHEGYGQPDISHGVRRSA
jgi:hypothetical protein